MLFQNKTVLVAAQKLRNESRFFERINAEQEQAAQQNMKYMPQNKIIDLDQETCSREHNGQHEVAADRFHRIRNRVMAVS